MNLNQTLAIGFGATVILTTLMSGSRGLRLTRMDIPFLLGTIFTSNRHRARWMGLLAHLCMGWIFSFIYVFSMENFGFQNWWFGTLIGLVHAMFLLTCGMNIITTIHPRVASEDRGPDLTRQLEPPGFMFLNYGRGTPITTVVSHLIFGFMLGLFSR